MDIELIKKQLESEKEELLIEIKKISIEDSDGGFEAIETRSDNSDVADQADLASEQTEFANNQAILFELEQRLENIDKALIRIQTGVYGVCVSCGEKIQEKRLQANFAASKCISCEEKEDGVE